MNDALKAAIEKVAKLRALAARAGTQAEAEAAAAQAAAIMAKYQIDEAVLEASAPEQAEHIQEGEALWSGERQHTWISVLAAGLCNIHGCAVIAQQMRPTATENARTVYRMAGRPSDVAIVRYLFAWLNVEIARLSESETGRAARNAFRQGATSGVLAAMRRSRATETAAATQSAAMVLAPRAEDADRWLKRHMGGRFHSAGAARGSADISGAYARGHAKGSSLAPNAALSGHGHRALPE